MNRRNSRTDETMCVICDLWWLWLLIFLLLVLALLTRNYWLPLFGVTPTSVSPTPVLSTATPVTLRVTNPVPSSAVIQATSAVTATDQVTPTTAQPIGIGSPAPDFSLPRLGGGEISLQDRNSKPAVLVFFASFDSFSQAEAPTLRQLGQHYGDQLVILPIDIAYNDRTEDVSKFVSDYNWTFPIGMDATGSVMSLYEQSSVPSHIFVNSNGKIVSMEGALTADQLQKQVSDLLSQ